MQAYFNLLSITLGIFGTLMIFFFGVPKQIDTGGRASIDIEQEDEKEKKKIKKYKVLGNVGIFLILSSFIFQLPANPIVQKFFLLIRVTI